jgi:hypothetical protein
VGDFQPLGLRQSSPTDDQSRLSWPRNTLGRPGETGQRQRWNRTPRVEPPATAKPVTGTATGTALDSLALDMVLRFGSVDPQTERLRDQRCATGQTCASHVGCTFSMLTVRPSAADRGD